MIDIHSHILPLIDDGSNSALDSISLLKEEYSKGVTDVILTPHYRKGEFEYSKTEILEKFENFKKGLENEENIPNIYIGQEIFCDDTIYPLMENKQVVTLNGSDKLLVEFNYSTYTDIADYVYNIKMYGYTPIIAHIERYTYIDKYSVIAIKENGGLIQVNANTIVGKLGKNTQTFVLRLIKDGLVDFVSSDIHFGRENVLLEAYNIVKKKFGVNVANNLFTENAKNYILN